MEDADCVEAPFPASELRDAGESDISSLFDLVRFQAGTMDKLFFGKVG